MRELELGGDVTDGEDVRHIGAHVVVDRDRAALGKRNARVLETEAGDLGCEADRHEHLAPDDLTRLAVFAGVGHGDRVAVVDNRLDLGRGEDLDAVVLVLLGDLFRHVGIFVRQRAIEEFDDRDLDAVVRQHVREFHADCAGADDDDRLGQLARHDLLFERDDVFAQLHAGQEPHGRTGGDDRVIEGDGVGAAVGEGHRDGVGIGERAAAAVLGDLVLLHHEVDALDAAVGNAAAAVEGGTKVEVHIARHTECGCLMVEDVRKFGVAQERLRRNAADVQTHAAPILLFDDRDLEAELGGANGGNISAGASTENHNIIVSRHVFKPSSAGGAVRGNE